MHLNLLHLDDALAGQSRFLDRCAAFDARHVDVRTEAKDVRLWGRMLALQKLQDQLSVDLLGLQGTGPIVTWLGSGDFHHVTALIVSLLTKARQKPVTIVHFDNHPDWVKHADGIHCGSWVSHVLETSIAERVVSLGMTSRDLAWPEFKGADLKHIVSKRLVVFPRDPPSSYVARCYGDGPAHTCRSGRIVWTSFPKDPADDGDIGVLRTIETDDIYITIDKDALTGTDATTNWDQGTLGLDDLLSWLGALMSRYRILGVDIVGDYSQPTYGGTRLDQFWKSTEALLDQPRAAFTTDAATRINEASNLKLLATLEAHLC